ncbi:MAG TPA: hypothetical protein VHI13_18955 [Candidatus Kapabacteria bacterium]|nr:hypothetical protein [Candidatus Kapabacteria bacterium]
MNQPHFTPAEHAHLTAYMLTLARALDLGSWDITLDHHPSSTNTLGQNKTIHGKRNATIYLHGDWRTDTPAELRSMLVHELLHCHFEPAWDIIDIDLANTRQLAVPAQEILEKTFGHQMELLIEQMVYLIAPALPAYEPPGTPPLPDTPLTGTPPLTGHDA